MQVFLSKTFSRIEYTLVGIALLTVFCTEIQNVTYHPDESQWIASSDSFEAFLRFNFLSPIFSDHHWALTQPQVTRYIIGLSRNLGGYEVQDLHLNPLFHSNEKRFVLDIPTPDQSLLWWSRFPMALLAVLSGLCLFYLGRRSSGRIGAYILLYLFLTNSYLLIILRRAMSEAPLLIAVLFAMILGMFAWNSWIKASSTTENTFQTLQKPFLFFLSVGCIGGIAASIKLNGATVVFAGILLAFLAVTLFPGNIQTSLRKIFLTRVLLGSILSALAVFILLNPFLYHNTFERMGRMLKYRVEEMQWQEMAYPENVISGSLNERTLFISKRIFQDYSSLKFPSVWIMTEILTVVGLIILVLSFQKTNRKALQQKRATHISILMVGVISAIPSLATPLDYDRYYLFPEILSIICCSIAIGESINLLVNKMWRAVHFP